MLAAVVTAFVAFTGIATLVPGGLAEPGGTPTGGTPMTEGWLVVLALNDALVALVLGYRLAVFRYGTAIDAARSAATFAIIIAITAGAVRAVDLPQLVGPAVLTLVFYLWDALHGSGPARRRRAPVPVGDDPAGRPRPRRGRLEPAAPSLIAAPPGRRDGCPTGPSTFDGAPHGC